MKKLIAIAVLATTTASFAASNSSINDLQYLPNAGTLFGETNVNYLSFSDTIFDGTGEARASTEGYVLAQNIGYALRDNFSLSANLSYSNSKSRFTGDSSTTSSGLGDIGVNGRYRLVDADNRLDILGTVSISPGDEEVKSDGDSNAFSGGHSLSVGAEYGAKKEHHQWAVRALLTHNLKSTEDNKDDDVKYKTDAHNSIGFAAQLLTKITDANYIRNFAGVDFTEEYEDNQDNSTSGSTVYTLGSEVQHVLSNDVFLKLGATALMPANGTSTVVMLYNFGARYQF